MPMAKKKAQCPLSKREYAENAMRLQMGLWPLMKAIECTAYQKISEEKVPLCSFCAEIDEPNAPWASVNPNVTK